MDGESRDIDVDLVDREVWRVLTARENLGLLNRRVIQDSASLEHLDSGSTSVGDGCLDGRVTDTLNRHRQGAVTLLESVDRDRKCGGDKGQDGNELHDDGRAGAILLGLAGS